VLTSRLEAISIRPLPTPRRWSPVVGRELKALIRRKALEPVDSDKLELETSRILAKCTPPFAKNEQQTGLVIGYVQSGKTLSFTALTALARDNKYRLIIVLGGTTTNLVDQSYARLATDLDVEGEGQRVWSMFTNPGARSDTMDGIVAALRSWAEYPERPDRCPTVVIVAMKDHRHLVNLAELLQGCEVDDVSTLIIDDEGDQAGLNNKVRQREESRTYSCIRVLRRVFPTHTYLLYTATPQAPLLISRIDMLSPQFADVIEPGQAYVGGRELFKAKSPYIEIIPSSELPDDEGESEPPESLEKALRLFFVGVAAGWVDAGKGNRSMMIHPSQLRDWQRRFVAWVKARKTTWLNLLRDLPNSPDRRALVDAFRESYDDLANTEPALPKFDRIVGELEYALHMTQIQEVNAREGRIPTVKWKQNYSFILVGGTGLDRGFTVEGLTVTYMPRGAGVGNADTVQQRGRFFGYKRPYIGLIRIFLEESVKKSFEKYVEHEKSIRQSLIAVRDSGKSLADWRRAFFLDRSMSPTRSSVLSLEYIRGRGRDWIYPKHPHAGDGILERNRKVVRDFLESNSRRFISDRGDRRRTPEQRHSHARGISLTSTYKDLLVPLTWTGDDLLDHLHILLQIERMLETDQAAICDIYQMSPSAERSRGLDKNGEIKNLMQGSNERSGYPGDRAIRCESNVTIQIHRLELTKEGAKGKNPHVIAHDVPVIAVAIPEKMRADAYFEPT
jgi:hypothetical protein